MSILFRGYTTDFVHSITTVRSKKTNNHEDKQDSIPTSSHLGFKILASYSITLAALSALDLKGNAA